MIPSLSTCTGCVLTYKSEACLTWLLFASLLFLYDTTLVYILFRTHDVSHIELWTYRAWSLYNFLFCPQVKRRRRVNRDVSKLFNHIKAYEEQPGRELFCLPSGLGLFTPFALRSAFTRHPVHYVYTVIIKLTMYLKDYASLDRVWCDIQWCFFKNYFCSWWNYCLCSGLILFSYCRFYCCSQVIGSGSYLLSAGGWLWDRQLCSSAWQYGHSGTGLRLPHIRQVC